MPRPIPRPRPLPVCPLELSRQQVEVRIDDQVAVTSVDQEFYNPNPRRMEGTVHLPVPKGAQLDRFAMEINGKPMDAELLSADKARRIYEDIVRKVKDPALLEYAGLDLYKVRIFPFEPHGRQRITMKWTQVLKTDSGLTEYVFPLNTAKYSSQPVKNLSVKINLHSEQPLQSIYSPSHDVEIRRDGARRAVIGHEVSEVVPDKDLQLYFSRDTAEVGVSLLAHRPDGDEGWFLLLASPGMDVTRDKIVKKDVVFVLDTSGSMAGPKIEQARKALLFCVENLNEGDRFELVRFSTEAEPLFRQLTTPTGDVREQARRFIKDLKATGGTAIHDALLKALALRPADSERPFMIIFLTDGLPTVGVTDIGQIVANVSGANPDKTRIFCFGIGTDVNTHLLDRITENTRAFSQYVLPEEDIEVKVSNFFSKIKEPVLTNPILRFSGDIRVSKLHPSALPDLYKGEQLVLAGRYSGSGRVTAVLEGTVNGKQHVFEYPVEFPSTTSEHDFVPRLWATRRVGYLLDEIRLHGENAELRDEVTDLARQYAIVTPYTAYLIVEDEARRDVPEALRSLNRFRGNPEAMSQAGRGYDAFRRQESGDAAVLSARYGLALKSASSADAALAAGNAEAGRSVALSPAAPPSATSRGFPAGSTSRVPMAMPAQRAAASGMEELPAQSRHVEGKTFFLNETRWVDSAVQMHAKADRVRIPFGSDAYFDLIAANPVVRHWLSLGAEVEFHWNGKIYEVHQP
jgi:Ca-activated chloride channel family protein